MLYEHLGARPRIHDTAVVAPTAVISCTTSESVYDTPSGAARGRRVGDDLRVVHAADAEG
ncbi:hypothetical protein CTI14_62035 [Methylobacterium radiotolerans]|nr:hypothetical protein CTI14_62035 [Methylobacterium radiotolerans]